MSRPAVSRADTTAAPVADTGADTGTDTAADTGAGTRADAGAGPGAWRDSSRPAAERAADLQAQVVPASRFGIPAVAHEECLTGFAAWTATIFPTPLAWGASPGCR
jgi:hypothetical protein